MANVQTDTMAKKTGENGAQAPAGGSGSVRRSGLSAEQQGRLRELWAADAAVDDIADAIGVAASTVKLYVKKLGLNIPENSTAASTGPAASTASTEPTKATKTRKPRKVQAKKTQAVLQPEDLETLGSVIVEARKAGLDPEDWVNRAREHVRAWDSLDGK